MLFKPILNDVPVERHNLSLSARIVKFIGLIVKSYDLFYSLFRRNLPFTVSSLSLIGLAKCFCSLNSPPSTPDFVSLST